jgi:hypothetical protein
MPFEGDAQFFEFVWQLPNMAQLLGVCTPSRLHQATICSPANARYTTPRSRS